MRFVGRTSRRRFGAATAFVPVLAPLEDGGGLGRLGCAVTLSEGLVLSRR